MARVVSVIDRYHSAGSADFEINQSIGGGNLNAVSMNQQTLENLPVFDQDYVATMSRFLDAGAIGTGGVTVVVDGLESTRVPVSASAIYGA